MNMIMLDSLCFDFQIPWLNGLFGFSRILIDVFSMKGSVLELHESNSTHDRHMAVSEDDDIPAVDGLHAQDHPDMRGGYLAECSFIRIISHFVNDLLGFGRRLEITQTWREPILMTGRIPCNRNEQLSHLTGIMGQLC